MPIPDAIARFQGLVEDELRAVLSRRKEPLYRMMEYQLGWIDDRGAPEAAPPQPRLHATLCMATCDALGGDASRALPAAAASELAHAFTQVHDDIRDGSPSHGPRPTVWWVWGPAQAINAGDGLHALARLSLFRLAERGTSPEGVLESTRVLDRACLDMFEGQHADLRFQEQPTVTREAYLRMAEQRSGALPGCAAELGALLAPADGPTREACRHAGRLLGVAMQIVQDIARLWGDAAGGQPGGDILARRNSLPVIHALEVAPVSVKRELGALGMKRVLDSGDTLRVVELLDGVGARGFCEERAGNAVEGAVSALAAAGMPAHGLDRMREIAGLVLRGGATALLHRPGTKGSTGTTPKTTG